MKYQRQFFVVSILVLTFLAPSSSAKRVLLMPFPITSHASVQVDIGRSLVERGHEVWLVFPDSVTRKGVLNTTGMSVIEYHTAFNVEDDIILDLMLKPFLAKEAISMDTMVTRFWNLSHEILSNGSLFEQIGAVQADLFVFDDDMGVARMLPVFAYKLGVPFAGVDYNFKGFSRRVAFSPACVPAPMTAFGPRMTLSERVKNTLMWFLMLIYDPWEIPDVVSRYAPEMPPTSLDRLAARAEVWLIQSDPVLNFPYPTLPNVKFIGGLAASPPKPLDSRFKSFMDSAKDGVIVVSFGSMVASLPKNITDTLMAAFMEMSPVKVVFRTKVTSPDPTQILTSSWLPQNALLAHRHCRVFVTHCGINGVYQALYHGVPMLGLPMFFDQEDNAHILELKGFGVRMDIREVKVQDLVNAIRKLTREPHYKQNITKASTLFREPHYKQNITKASTLFREPHYKQ
ncbi:UDP-glucuronosyltransferase 2B10-like, partial [Littorina saxatilis]|uniref:UDP-glucuronosyltransferase 2B10-like n=1 Tax=Littorina saxatilis TaxID=31220 RepID=UPI0038B593DE